jgi:flagellar biosynthesis protein FliQ
MTGKKQKKEIEKEKKQETQGGGLMPADLVVELARSTLEVAVWLAAPLLAVATVVSLAINIVQVLTSLQESTLSIVPRLAAVAAAIFLLMPWMVRRLDLFTIGLFSDFRPFLR